MDQRLARNAILTGGVAVAVVVSFFVGRNSVRVTPQPATLPSSAAPVVASTDQPARVETPPVRAAGAPREGRAEIPTERTAANPPAPERPIAAARLAAANGAAPANTNPVVQSLTTARRHMERARRALQGATADNHGGFVEKARTDAEAAITDLAAAVAYANEHPEVKELPAETSADSDAAIKRIKSHSLPSPNTQANMVTALEALQATVDAVQQAGGAGLGGTRDKLIADLDRAATNVVAGFDLAHKSGALP